MRIPDGVIKAVDAVRNIKKQHSPVPESEIINRQNEYDVNEYYRNIPKRNEQADIARRVYLEALQKENNKSKFKIREVKRTPTRTLSRAPIRPDIVIDPETQEFIENTLFPVTDRYGIPRAVAAGQFAGEGRLKGLGASRNNYFNIMAYDGREGDMPGYATPEEGIEAYAKLMSGQYKLADGNFDTRYVPAYEMRNKPEEMIRKIHALGYATRPDYADFIMSTPEYKKYLE